MAWPRFRLTGVRLFTLWTALVLLAFLGVSFAMLYISQKNYFAKGRRRRTGGDTNRKTDALQVFRAHCRRRAACGISRPRGGTGHPRPSN